MVWQGFQLKNGPLLEAANNARRDAIAAQEQGRVAPNHYLVIDEINRGNLAKVFGELYFLLEYRDEEISLQYSDAGLKFSFPPNLYIIGTMNTADRSIALVDLALRRRFHFVDFRPSESPIKDVLRNWLARKAPKMTWVADVVDRANDLLEDRHAAIGPSYFMKDDLSEDTVNLTWDHNVLPYLEERLIGQPERLTDFSLRGLRSLGREASEGDEVEDMDDDGTGDETD